MKEYVKPKMDRTTNAAILPVPIHFNIRDSRLPFLREDDTTQREIICQLVNSYIHEALKEELRDQV